MPELLSSLPVVLRALQRGKVTPGGALLHKHKAPKEVKRIFRDIHDREERYELNLYVVGEEDEPDGQSDTQASAAGGQLPAERSPNK